MCSVYTKCIKDNEYLNLQKVEKALKILQKKNIILKKEQKEVIFNLLNHLSVIAVLPTGFGKSLCFQIPMVILEGLTIVISPLIALMNDQVQQLWEVGINSYFLSSDMLKEATATVLEALASGQVKCLFLTPERLTLIFLEKYLKKIEISQVVIDEAHCIFQWGNTFSIHSSSEVFAIFCLSSFVLFGYTLGGRGRTTFAHFQDF